MKEIKNNLNSYLQYLQDLIKKNKFNCCQLEQAIGVIENNQLLIFLSSDTGLCYNSKYHFEAINEIFKYGKSGSKHLNINTYYGILKTNTVRIQYSNKTNNIEHDNSENLIFEIKSKEFEMKLERLKKEAKSVFKQLKNKLHDIGIPEMNEPLDNVFNDKLL